MEVMTQLQLDELAWHAAQGNKKAQVMYADYMQTIGEQDWADYYYAKAKGKNPYFSLELFLKNRD